MSRANARDVASGSALGCSVPPSRASSEPLDVGSEIADERDAVALGAEAEPPGTAHVRQLADEPDHRRRVDRPVGTLVVERDVAADDRDLERAAGVAERREPTPSAARRCAASRGCRS